ncbi:MAG: CehA/McbA family metallohydrolase [bacterium]
MLTITRLITLVLLSCLPGAALAPRVVLGVPRSMNVPTRTVERFVHIAPPGANDSRYVYVPFDVPPNTTRVSVSYQYDRARGANTIDLGLFDARSTGIDTDPRGFRGWSGGRRSDVFVSRDEATPGYMPGEMPAGRWRIILGLYRIAETGVDVSFKIEIETSSVAGHRERTSSPGSTASSALPGSSAKRSVAPLLAGNGMLWFAGDLHMHTVHSDGDWTIAGLISAARDADLDFIVITDHNTASHHWEIDRLTRGSQEPLVLRGEEITTYGGHTNAWGLPSGTWIDFRTHPGDNARISEIAAQAHRAGALISVNHPFVLCGGCAWSYDAAAPDFDAIEVWNGPWDFTDEPAVKMWDKILQTGRHITAVASSDSHRPDTPIGKPATHLAAKNLTQANLLMAIREGHAFLTDGVRGHGVAFEAEAATGKHRARTIIGDQIRLGRPGNVRFFISTRAAPSNTMISLISNGQVLRTLTARTDGQPQVIELECQRDSYFRLEVRDATKTMLALTNPIYVKVGQ